VPQIITTLTLQFTIGAKGRVDGAQAVDEDFGLLALERNGTVSADAADRLRNSATEALERWRYDAPAAAMTAFVRFEFVPGATGHVIWHAASPPPPILTEEASIGGRTSRLVRIGGSMPVPKRTTHVDPAYPSIARSAQIEGTLALKLVVSEAGDVVDARPLRSIPIFDDAAVRAVRAWKYERLRIDGKPAAFVVVVAIIYELDTPAEMRGLGVVVDPSGAP
jgi:protein TonB